MNREPEIDRFLEACATGKAVSRRANLGALGMVMRSRDALRAVANLEAVHPEVQRKILEGWTRVAVWQSVRHDIGDDGLWFAALRKLLPPYDGGPEDLVRGQLEGEPLGMSWTRSWHIAEKFARFGTASDYEIRTQRREPRPGAIVIEAVACCEIICAPCLLGHKEGEFIIDPRGVTVGQSWRLGGAEAA